MHTLTTRRIQRALVRRHDFLQFTVTTNKRSIIHDEGNGPLSVFRQRAEWSPPRTAKMSPFTKGRRRSVSGSFVGVAFVFAVQVSKRHYLPQRSRFNSYTRDSSRLMKWLYHNLVTPHLRLPRTWVMFRRTGTYLERFPCVKYSWAPALYRRTHRHSDATGMHGTVCVVIRFLQSRASSCFDREEHLILSHGTAATCQGIYFKRNCRFWSHLHVIVLYSQMKDVGITSNYRWRFHILPIFTLDSSVAASRVHSPPKLYQSPENSIISPLFTGSSQKNAGF